MPCTRPDVQNNFTQFVLQLEPLWWETNNHSARGVMMGGDVFTVAPRAGRKQVSKQSKKKKIHRCFCAVLNYIWLLRYFRRYKECVFHCETRGGRGIWAIRSRSERGRCQVADEKTSETIHQGGQSRLPPQPWLDLHDGRNTRRPLKASSLKWCLFSLESTQATRLELYVKG
jgi:hypothetical protein